MKGVRLALVCSLEDYRERHFSNLSESLREAKKFIDLYEIRGLDTNWSDVLYEKIQQREQLCNHPILEALAHCSEREAYRFSILTAMTILLFDPETSSLNFERLDKAEAILRNALDRHPTQECGNYMIYIREALAWSYNFLWKYEGPYDFSLLFKVLPKIPEVIPTKRERTELGILFAATRDPLSSIYRAVTKQDFSSIGFYHTTTIGGKRKVRVILLDPFGEKTPWVSDKTTLEDLCNNPRILSLAKRELNSEKKREFLLSVGSETNKVTSSQENIRYLLLQMMGVRTENRGISALDILSNVMEAVGESVSPQWKISTASLESIAESSQRLGRLDILSLMASQLTSANSGQKQISSYLNTHPSFGELVHLPLREFLPSEILAAEQELISSYCRHIETIARVFTQLLLSDPEFLSTVRQCLEPKRIDSFLLPTLISEQKKLLAEIRRTDNLQVKETLLHRVEILANEMELLNLEVMSPEAVLEKLTPEHLITLLRLRS
jgi:hypothetical protein